MEHLGSTRWIIADGYIPGGSTAPSPELASHETASVLNTGDRAAAVAITVFFEDRDPAGPYRVEVGARRTSHVRLDQLTDPEPVPRDTPYAVLVESDVAVVVQHTRLDSRQAENALLSTIAFPVAI